MRIHFRMISDARECLRDPSQEADAMRDLAIRIVRERDARDALAEVRKYARHRDVEVRRSALVTLAGWQDEESRGAMEEAAKSDNALLRRCGEMALKWLASAPDAKTRHPSEGPTGDGEAKSNEPLRRAKYHTAKYDTHSLSFCSKIR